MFRIQVFIALLTVPVFSSFSQQEFTFSSDLVWKQPYDPVKRELNYENINGSPYLIDNLIEGSVRFTKGKEIINYLRYNIYTDEMEYLDGSKLMVIKNPNDIQSIYLGNFVFNFLYYSLVSGHSKTGYLIKVVDGDCKLYKKLNIDFVKEKPATSSYDPPKAASFVERSATWFLSFNNNPPSQVVFDKNVVDRVFDKYESVKQYAKDQKLKGKNPGDFAEIVKYFNAQ